MMRFITHNLTGIDGVAIYPIISLLIFVLFFALVLTRVLRMSKGEIAELSDIPLNDSSSILDDSNH
jgi:fructose-specific phosphotransferase system IIC component